MLETDGERRVDRVREQRLVEREALALAEDDALARPPAHRVRDGDERAV